MDTIRSRVLGERTRPDCTRAGSRGCIITAFRDSTPGTAPDLATAKPPPAGFPALTRAVERAGLFRPRPWAYVDVLVVNIVLAALGVTMFVILAES